VPFHDYTTIELIIPKAGHYVVDILDFSGRVVRQLVNQPLAADVFYFDWDGTNGNQSALPQGIYFIRCSASGYLKTIKVIKSK
jgi:flagellar hook assembly protein FlgD